MLSFYNHQQSYQCSLGLATSPGLQIQEIYSTRYWTFKQVFTTVFLTILFVSLLTISFITLYQRGTVDRIRLIFLNQRLFNTISVRWWRHKTYDDQLELVHGDVLNECLETESENPNSSNDQVETSDGQNIVFSTKSVEFGINEDLELSTIELGETKL